MADSSELRKCLEIQGYRALLASHCELNDRVAAMETQLGEMAARLQVLEARLEQVEVQAGVMEARVEQGSRGAGEQGSRGAGERRREVVTELGWGWAVEREPTPETGEGCGPERMVAAVLAGLPL